MPEAQPNPNAAAGDRPARAPETAAFDAVVVGAGFAGL